MNDRLTLMEKLCRDAREFGVMSKNARDQVPVAPRLLLAGAPDVNGESKVSDPGGELKAAAAQMSVAWFQALMGVANLCGTLAQEAAETIKECRPELERVGVKFQ